MSYRCSHCGARKFWKLGNGEHRCRGCRRDTKPRLVARMRLTRGEWVKLVDLYLIGANSPTLSHKLRRTVPVITKALRLLRACMASDVPEIFSGTVEVDETYLGGQWKNKRKEVQAREASSKRGRGTTKQPVFGILARNGQVWAELVEDVEAGDLVPLITKQVQAGQGRITGLLGYVASLHRARSKRVRAQNRQTRRERICQRQKSHQRPRRFLGISQKKTGK